MLLKSIVMIVVSVQFSIIVAGTAPVASKSPNQFGLYDMIGNVWEMCNDIYYLRQDSIHTTNPCKILSDNDFQFQLRTMRGGSWQDPPFLLRSANRQSIGISTKYYHIGFRCVLNGTNSNTSAKGMKLIPGGVFNRGSKFGSDELPILSITVSSFFMDSTEVTQKSYKDIMGSNPSFFKGENLPVECIRWIDAINFCNRKSIKAGLDTVYSYDSVSKKCNIDLSKNGYRLPTEAEWEYACKANTTTDFFWQRDLYPFPSTNADSSLIDQYAIWRGNAVTLKGPPPPSVIPDIAPPRTDVAVVHCSTSVQLMNMFYRFQSFNMSKPVTIYLKDGEYDLSYWQYGNDGNGTEINIDIPNTSIIGESKDPTKVILRGRKFYGGDWAEELLKVRADSVTLAYFTIVDVGANGIKLDRKTETDSVVKDITIHNVYFEDVCERSIKVPQSATFKNVHVQYCNFEQITSILSIHPTCDYHSDGNYIAGIDAMRIDNWNIRNNVFKNIRGITGNGRGGIFLWVKCNNSIIENNIIANCDRGIALGNPSGDSLHGTGLIVRNNIIVKGNWYAVEICRNTGLKFYNNTIFSWKPDSAMVNIACFHLWSNYTNNQIKNNIIFGGLWLDTGVMPDTQNNKIIITSDKTISQAIWFKDPVNYDFHLSSQALDLIDKGLDLEEVKFDIDNEARSKSDIGADEYNSKYGARVLPERKNSLNSIEFHYFNNSNLCVSFKSVEEIKDIRFQIVAMNGRLLENRFEKVNNNKATFNVGSIPSGSYTLKLWCSQGIYLKTMVLINK